MTKEELEKEADDYVANTDTSICEFEGIVTIICDGEGNAIDADSIAKSAYLAGAEPREKKIRELEEENTELKKLNDEALCLLNEVNKDGERRAKENAKLKSDYRELVRLKDTLIAELEKTNK